VGDNRAAVPSSVGTTSATKALKAVSSDGVTLLLNEPVLFVVKFYLIVEKYNVIAP
jgi:hypothetical protein